jgi:putative endonuclease
MFYYTYVLFSDKDGQFYSGYTKNLKRRFKQHQAGEVISTSDRIPLALVYYESCLNQQDAMQREKYFKTHHGRMFLGKRLKSYLTGCKK